MEKEKKKQKNVNDHDKKAESAKALHVSKYKHSYQNEREFMEDRFEEAYFFISYDPPGNRNCQLSVICKSLRRNCKTGDRRVFREPSTSAKLYYSCVADV